MRAVNHVIAVWWGLSKSGCTHSLGLLRVGFCRHYFNCRLITHAKQWDRTPRLCWSMLGVSTWCYCTGEKHVRLGERSQVLPSASPVSAQAHVWKQALPFAFHRFVPVCCVEVRGINSSLSQGSNFYEPNLGWPPRLLLRPIVASVCWPRGCVPTCSLRPNSESSSLVVTT